MIDRILSRAVGNSKKSALLLGPRQTGKSTLVKSLKPDLSINLADEIIYLNHAQDFSLLRSLIERSHAKRIFIDEVQRIPELLNTVQALIDESSGLKFYLTGSSARKLKKGGANLLPGRVINYSMGPLTLKELNYSFKREDLIYGYLPGIYNSDTIKEKSDLLSSYSSSYLKEEIKAESLVRDIPSFARFLEVIPRSVTFFIDYSKLAKSAKVSRHQISRFFEIFEDTMIGTRIFSDPRLTEKYDLIKHPQFYFFDVGVYNGLQNAFDLSPERLGILCEQTVFQQLFHTAHALQKNIQISTFRTRGGVEIDFWVKLDSKDYAIEVKATDKIIDDDLRHLALLKKQEPQAQFYLFHFGKAEVKKGGIWCLPIGTGLKEMGL